MHPTAPRYRLLFALFLTLVATTASAQSRFYVGGTAVADVRRFDSIEIDPRVLAGLAGIGDVSSRDGTAAGGGLRVGTFLHPLWSLELAVDAGGRTTNKFRNPIEILPARSSTLRLPELSTSTSFLTVSTVIGFHPQKTGRFQLGYLGGLALVRGTYKSTFPNFSYIPLELAFMSGPSSFASAVAGFGSLTQPVPIITGGQTISRTNNSVGGVLGLEASVDVMSRLSFVPGLRTIVFSDQGQSVFLIRPEVGVRWTF
jgi:hypothetical protein